MAIPFLNNITLNNNEIQNVRLQNAGSPPLNSGPGQIYFDTTTGDETAKYYSNVTDEFVSLKEYSFPTGTYVTGTVTGTTPKPIITFDLNAVDGTAAAGERYLTKSNTWAEVSGISGTTYDLEGVGSANGTAGVRLSGSDATNDDVLIVGAGTTTVTRSGNTLTVTSNDQFDGTVTNVSASTTGDALDVAVTNPTTTPDLDFTWAGTASQYVDGQGDLQTFPAIPTVGDGTLTVQGTGVLGGTGTFTANQAGNTTISVTHDSQAQTNTTPSTTLTHGGTFTALSSNVGVNSSGHVTGQELTTFTLPTIPTNIVETFSNNNTGVYVAYGNVNSSATGNVNIGEVDLTAVDGTAIAGERYLTKSNTWATVASIPGTYDWDIQGDSGGPTTVTSGDVIDIAGGTNVTTALSGTTLTINSTDQFQGTLTGITEGPGITVTASATSPTVAVDYLGSDNYLLEAGVATVASSEDIINFSDDTDSNVKKTTLGTIPVNSLTLVKNYIDSSVSGGVYYQGGYNPTTDLTSPGNYGLQTPPNPNIIEIGWMYTVTADGTFFGEQVRVGDVLIAEIDAPTSLSDWTTVQNNIDLATSLVVGLGNVVPGSSNTITAPYSSGTATLDVVDSTPAQKGAVIVDAGTGISVSYASGTATVANTQTNSANTYAETITDSVSGTTFDHGLGDDVIVQLYDATTKETVYADVQRNGNYLNITFSATPTNSVRVLVQKIG